MKRGMVLLAGMFALGAGAPAAAVELEGAAQQASAYLSLEFGGSSQGVQSLRYGLQLDQGHRAAGEELLPAAIKLDFTGAGLQQIALAGLPVARRVMALSQDEGMSEGTEAAATETAWYDPTGWGWVGWGIAGAGAVGAYVLLDDDDDDSQPAGNDDDGDGDGTGGDDEICVVDPICVPGGLPLPLASTGAGDVAASAIELDAGTGFMGDLIAR